MGTAHPLPASFMLVGLYLMAPFSTKAIAKSSKSLHQRCVANIPWLTFAPYLSLRVSDHLDTTDSPPPLPPPPDAISPDVWSLKVEGDYPTEADIDVCLVLLNSISVRQPWTSQLLCRKLCSGRSGSADAAAGE